MRKIFFLLFITIFTTIMFAQEKHAITVEDLWNMKRIGQVVLSPDGKTLAFEVTTYNMDENKGNTTIYLCDSTGANLRELKNEHADKSEPCFNLTTKSIFYIHDDQLWECSLDGSSAKKITDFYSGVSGVVWSPTGKQLLFVSSVYPDCSTQECNKAKDEAEAKTVVKAKIFTELMYRHWNRWRGEKRSHLFLYDVTTKKYTDLTPNATYDVPPIDLGGDRDYDFSPDAEEVVFTANKDKDLALSTNNEIYIINLKDTSYTHHKISTSKGNDNQPVYSPSGDYIAFRSMKRAGFEADQQMLMIYDRNGKKLINFAPKLELSIGEIKWSNDSQFIYYTSANEVNVSILRVNFKSDKHEFMIKEFDNSNVLVSPYGKNIYFKQMRSTRPNEIFTFDLTNGKTTQLTNINKEITDNIEWNNIETFWSEGAEGAKVQSILVKPPFFDANKKYPMIFLIHGGPQGAWTDDFHYRWNTQMFASKGYVVVAVNPRGSTGYGQKFCDEISGDWGGKPYIDLMKAYDYAVSNYKFIDKNNTFAAGASYGGYMINWLEGHETRFNAVVSHDGVFNLESMYGTTEELWFPEWEYQGTPWTNREMYVRWSPHQFVQNFKTPMLVIHGAKDFRVPEGQAFELFTALQRMKVESKFLYFPDETHFVTKPQNAKLWWNTIFDWFEQYKRK